MDCRVKPGNDEWIDVEATPFFERLSQREKNDGACRRAALKRVAETGASDHAQNDRAD
jgi:hypothetical protein